MRNQIEPYLRLHVLPELKSPHAYLRARACTVIMYFEQVSENLFSDPVNQQYIFENMLVLLQDSDLPVRVWSCLALRECLYYASSKAKKTK